MNLLSTFLLAGFFDGRMFYALPLLVVISLVYGATRHERMKPILIESGKMAMWLTGAMLVLFVLIFYISLGL